jgi:hypothetical protein
MKKLDNPKVSDLKKLLEGSIIESVEQINENEFVLSTRSFIKSSEYYKTRVKVQYSKEQGLEIVYS